MKQRYSKILILFLLVLAGSNAFAQQIKGVVTDSVTHEPLMYISVYYQEKRDMGTITNIDGEYKLETRRNGGTLVFSAVGYISKTVKVGSGNQTINIVGVTDTDRTSPWNEKNVIVGRKGRWPEVDEVITAIDDVLKTKN